MPSFDDATAFSPTGHLQCQLPSTLEAAERCVTWHHPNGTHSEPSFSSNYQNVSFITKESKHLKDTLPNDCRDTQTEVFVGLSAFP